MEYKRLTLFAGHYGSGKTNIAVNYAILLAGEGKPVCIADMDIVNPYFRTADSASQLAQAGVRLISPQFANTNVDLPALPAETYTLIENKNVYGIMDIGGDDRGAYALGRYVPAILQEDNYRMAFVFNCYRPLTRTPNEAMEIMGEIEQACGLKFTCIVNNSNLGPETTKESVTESVPIADELSRISGLPIWLHTVREDLVQDLQGKLDNLMPLNLQTRYFDLPTQKPENRPLWG